MKNRQLLAFFIAIVATVAILFSACKKINESTELGGGLIPPVDNITTFDTLIDVQTFNDTFSLLNDSTRIHTDDEMFLGKITNDPFFGRTDARLFFELLPPSYPFTFLNKKDSLHLDSVVLVLDYIETYGDTLVPQTINVYEMDPSPANSNFKRDSNYLIRQTLFTYSGAPLGTKTVIPAMLKDSVKAYRDTTIRQLRIPLSNSFGQRLLNYDTSMSFITGAFATDSAFRSKFKGFALESTSGNAVMGFDLRSPNTKLAIYYKYDKWSNNVPNVDTAVAYFYATSVVAGQQVIGAAANGVKRDYTGTPLEASLMNGSLPDPIVFLQNTPGSFATVKIPGLATVSNRVVHRAELVMEQIYDPSDSLFRPPNFLYLDANDPTIPIGPKFRTIPYDLGFLNSSTLSYDQFGVAPVMSVDPAGNRIRTWRFNISRYIQHVLTGTQTLYDLRLFPAFRFVENLGIPPGGDIYPVIAVNPTILQGRIRLGGGNHPTQRMRLRIVYSKL